MSQQISLKEAERKVFQSAIQDGLYDIFIGCVLLVFVIAPFLSPSMGDFWSSAMLVPFWALVQLGIWLIRRYVVTPRIGVVKFGPARRTRLFRFNATIFVVLLVALLLGILSAVDLNVPGWVHTARFGLVVLVAFSVAAYFLGFTLLYIYGALIALSPLVGEWLYANVGASHHGFPIAFGVTAGIIILVGLVKFLRLLRNYPLPAAGTPLEEV
jgi:hypothetical protein